jgi:hypothetical protein
MSQLPPQVCPKTQKRNCPICGPWLGWVDLQYPTRQPTPSEWDQCCKDLQTRHNQLRTQEFNSLQLVPIAKEQNNGQG